MNSHGQAHAKTASRPPDRSPRRIASSGVLLGLICFVAGAAMMVIEISANRLLAPNFGNSLYTWTALIGVILVAFSVGRLSGRRAGGQDEAHGSARLAARGRGGVHHADSGLELDDGGFAQGLRG